MLEIITYVIDPNTLIILSHSINILNHYIHYIRYISIAFLTLIPKELSRHHLCRSSIKDVKMTYNEPESSISGTPVAVTFNYGLVNDFLLEWNKKKIELSTGKITPEEYFERKIKFPE